MAATIPKTMRALRLHKLVEKHSDNAEDYAGHFKVDEVPVPKPASGEVLVRVSHAPINPSDLSTMQGSYNSAQRAELPCGLGFEASGVVVASGGGFLANRLVGKRIATATTGEGCLYAEYAVVEAMNCLELPRDVTFAGGCSCFVNPLTTMSFVEIAKSKKCKTIVHTAAASTLGKMLVPYARDNGIKVICIVRREAQREQLAALGAEYIVSTSEDGWEEQLKKLTHDMNAKLAFDAVAGGSTGMLVRNMPNGSTVKVYGDLSGQPSGGISPADLIFRQVKVEGFWLTAHMKAKNIFGLYSSTRTVTKLLQKSLATTIRKECALDEAEVAISDYIGNMSLGKIAFCPGKKAGEEEEPEVVEHLPPDGEAAEAAAAEKEESEKAPKEEEASKEEEEPAAPAEEEPSKGASEEEAKEE